MRVYSLVHLPIQGVQLGPDSYSGSDFVMGSVYLRYYSSVGYLIAFACPIILDVATLSFPTQITPAPMIRIPPDRPVSRVAWTDHSSAHRGRDRFTRPVSPKYESTN